MTTPLDAELPPPSAWTMPRRYGSGLSFVRPMDYEDEEGELVQPEPLYSEDAVREAIAADRAARQPAPPDVAQAYRDMKGENLQDDLAAASLVAPAAQAQQRSLDTVDAARYRWLRNRFLGVDFDWGSYKEDGTHGKQVLLIDFDGGVTVWGDLDITVDNAMDGND